MAGRVEASVFINAQQFDQAWDELNQPLRESIEYVFRNDPSKLTPRLGVTSRQIENWSIQIANCRIPLRPDGTPFASLEEFAHFCQQKLKTG